MRKSILIGGLLVGSLLFAGCGKSAPKGTATPTPRVRKVDVNVNQEPIANRPFVQLVPRDDGHAVILNLLAVKKVSSNFEYEIEYNSGSLVQGAFGEAAIDVAKLPLTREILLGSCSTGGKCTYNPDVTGGTLILRFLSPDYTLKNEWSFAEAAKAGNSFTSRDAKFTLDTTKAKLKTGNVIVFQSPGYPKGLTGEVVAGPYTVGLNTTITASVTVSVRVASDVKAATLMGWDGKAWKELGSKIANQQLTYTGTLLDAYVVVKK